MEHCIVATATIKSIESAHDAATLWMQLTTAKAAIRRATDEVEAAILEWAKRESVVEFDLDADSKVCIKKKVTPRFDTAAIYKALDFTEEQVAVLPANPNFRKTAILENAKTAPAFFEEEEDKIEVKEINVKMIKEIAHRKKLAQAGKGAAL